MSGKISSNHTTNPENLKRILSAISRAMRKGFITKADYSRAVQSVLVDIQPRAVGGVIGGISRSLCRATSAGPKYLDKTIRDNKAGFSLTHEALVLLGQAQPVQEAGSLDGGTGTEGSNPNTSPLDKLLSELKENEKSWLLNHAFLTLLRYWRSGPRDRLKARRRPRWITRIRRKRLDFQSVFMQQYFREVQLILAGLSEDSRAWVFSYECIRFLEEYCATDSSIITSSK